MPISVSQFISHYPRLYHMAEADTWASIKRYGLLSTSALLDLFQITGSRRLAIETTHRPESVVISDPQMGSVVIRDQKPLKESTLANCLCGTTPAGWYRLLNGMVFFWVTEQRVCTLLGARAYRRRKHTVITVDSAHLIEKYGRVARLCAINSGSAIYRPTPRGPGIFQPFDDYPFEERRKLRGMGNAVAELVLPHALPDIKDFVLRVEHRQDGRVTEVLYDGKS